MVLNDCAASNCICNVCYFADSCLLRCVKTVTRFEAIVQKHLQFLGVVCLQPVMSARDFLCNSWEILHVIALCVAKMISCRGGQEHRNLRPIDFVRSIDATSGRAFYQYNHAGSKNYQGGLKDNGHIRNFVVSFQTCIQGKCDLMGLFVSNICCSAHHDNQLCALELSAFMECKSRCLRARQFRVPFRC